MKKQTNHRRRFLMASSALLLGGIGGWSLARPALINPCRAAATSLANDNPWLQRTWQNLDPAKVWDCHVHLAGTGDSDSGIKVGPQLSTPFRPLQYAQRLFYMNAGCVHNSPGQVDSSYVDRLLNLVEAMPAGFKLMLFAFDYFHDDQGQALPDSSSFYVPNAYALKLAQNHPSAFEWVASIHPYRANAVAQLEAAAAQGARAIKWLPAAMNINPDSPRCQPFYDAMARLNIPLITHCGEEKAVQGADTQHYGNPLLLRRALNTGVKVVVAHCASLGEDQDLDQRTGKTSLPSFELFARMMDTPEYQNHLFADISAITQRNRSLDNIRTLLTRQEWHPRLLNGSDYPLPGILPLVSPGALADAGLLPADAVQDLTTLREHNPIYFDLALKRNLNWQGNYFSDSIFETRNFFEATPA